MTLTTIEKAAKLLGLHELEYRRGSDAWYYTNPDSGREEFNPYTNKADLVDVECALGIAFWWGADDISAWSCAEGFNDEDITGRGNYADHPDKFTARAHAVMAVVEQIYDRREG